MMFSGTRKSVSLDPWGKLAALLLVFGPFFQSVRAEAGKMDLSFGYFSITAQTSKGTGDVKNFGSYSLAYRHELFPSVEAWIGYSLLMASVIGGDLSYGLDLGGSWYPFSRASASRWSSEMTQFTMLELWRPFVSGGFSQRQIRQTSYAGLLVGLGVERSLTSLFSLRAEARYLLLVGPSPASARQADVLAGVSISL